MTKYIEGSAIDYMLEDTNNRVLLHCVNAQGKMNSGIAKEVRNRIAGTYENYLKSGYKLGTVSYGGGFIVANMVAQKHYGYDGARYVDYGALVKCLLEVVKFEPIPEFVIPYNMCSDRAGGDFKIVMELCEAILGKDNITVVKLK